MISRIAEMGWDALRAGRTLLADAYYGRYSARRAPIATAEDEITRERQGFHRVEATLPTEFTIAKASWLDRLSSFVFGIHNPIAREADSRTDFVWLLDNTAYRPGGDPTASWTAEFVAAYFSRGSGKDLTAAISNIADKIGIDDGQLGERETARKTIELRLRPFALGVQPARYVQIEIDGDSLHRLGPGDTSGISSQVIGQFSTRNGGGIVRSNATDESLAPCGEMSTYLVEPEGWMVISDIDDTIKVTMTSSPIGVLQSTFYDAPTAIQGMPEFYKQIQSQLQPNWFYLSASPYTLYTFLRPFLHAHYPRGSIMLRDASWQDLNGLLQSFTVGTQAYKSSRIEKMQNWLPLKKVLCIGDSTQSDPEAYGEMYRKHRGWIKAIFIRKVTGVAGIDATSKNSPDRFEKAFKDIPRSAWKVFENPSELERTVRDLVTV